MSKSSERSAESLAKEIIEFGQSKDFDKLQKLIAKCDSKLLERTVTKRIDRSDGSILWNYIFIGCDSNSDTMATKRFNIMMAVLNEMNKIEITSKQSFDLMTRTFIELPKLRVSELISLCEYCSDSLRMGDPKCTGWKELFPEILKLLSEMPKITVHNEIKTGNEYCESIVKTLLSLRWPETVLSSIGAMFLETPISKTDKVAVLNKLCANLGKLEPQELPTLAFQLFTLSSTPAQLMIPLIALNQYFQKYLYQKQFSQTDSNEINFDSIDRFSDNDLISAQNTILYHLSNCAEHKIGEKELIQQIRPMASNPKYILTPFLLSALLTICNVSRYLESARLSGSSALPFLRTVIQNNEKELELCENSAWFRDTLEHHPADVAKLNSILIQQSKEDIFTPGLVGLAFVLLKTPQYSAINVTGIHFIEEIVKVRYQLGYGILRNLKEFLFADQGAAQYGECLTRLSLTNPMMVSEELGQLKEIMDFFLLIPGHHAMRMMTFILPLTKHNNQIRDYFIDILRRAMYQSDLSTRQMAIYGFCALLKQQRMNSSWRSSSGRLGPTQMSISGFSLMSQQTLGTTNNPNMMFDMFVLEIIGILRKCFNQPYEIKSILYDGLTSAIQQNYKLIQHVLQFIDWHFRSYFTESANEISINFDKCINETIVDDVPTIYVQDHIGKLLHFISQCIILLDISGLEFDVTDLKEFFEELLIKIDSITMEKLGLVETLTPSLSHIGQQYLNCLEGLMYHCLKTNDFGQKTLATIYRLYQHHKKCLTKLQDALVVTKRSSRKKTDECDLSMKLSLQNVTFKPENIWELQAVHSMLEAVSRASTDTLLQDKIDFCVYILNVTSSKVEGMRTAPEYMQVKYSKSNFKHLSDITAMVINYFVKNLSELLTDSNIQIARASVECLKECLTTATTLYQRKFLDFLKVSRVTTTDNPSSNELNVNLISILHNVLDKISKSFENNDIDLEHHVILVRLFQSLELLYNNITLTPEQATEIHAWLQNYCEYYNFENKDLAIIHKLLFAQRIRVKNGEILSGIAKQIERLYGQVEDEPIEGATEMKSINEMTVEACTGYLCIAIRKQIEDVEYFINKVRGYCIQLKTGGQSEDERENCESRMVTTERRICSQLVFIYRVCLHLSNAMLPLGTCMDNLHRMLIQYYICLTNLSKHFINRHRICPVSSKSTKFYQLVQTIGKKLPLKIYSLIAYIDNNIDGENNDSDADEDAPKRSKKKDGGKTDKARVVRETKYIPKLVLRIETWNKFVICLSKKTDHDLSKCLHLGTVRDFRIKTPAIRKAIEKYRQNGDSDSDVENDDGDIEEDASDDEIDINIDETTSGTSSDALTGNTATSTSSSIIKEKEVDTSVTTTVLKNMATINKKVTKRKKRDIENANESEEDNRSKRKKSIEPPPSTNTRRSNRINPSK